MFKSKICLLLIKTLKRIYSVEDLCHLSKNAQDQSDNLQAESCKDWNFTGQAVKFFGLFTTAKQFH